MRDAHKAEGSTAGFVGARHAPPLALAALVLGRWLPADGWGFSLCWFKLLSGYPCLCCGLTRSFLHTLHGDWAAAFQLHPLGPPLVVLCVLTAAMPIMPAPIRRRWEERLAGYRSWSPAAASAVVAILLLNGAYRLWWTSVLKQPSPW